MKILHMDCSPRHESHSRKLSAALVSQLSVNASSVTIVRRDLGREPIPHLDTDYATALSSPTELAAIQSSIALSLSEHLIREVEAADVIVIGTPMNNFTIPSVLKAWIDQILRMGRTIGTSPSGDKMGLLKDKPVYIGVASGGVFTGPGAKQPDFLIPYLTIALGCVGLQSLQFFPLQATAFLDAEKLALDRQRLIESMTAAPSNTLVNTLVNN